MVASFILQALLWWSLFLVSPAKYTQQHTRGSNVAVYNMAPILPAAGSQNSGLATLAEHKYFPLDGFSIDWLIYSQADLGEGMCLFSQVSRNKTFSALSHFF